jgi:predicted Zn finger-like uncharacterized protein
MKIKMNCPHCRAVMLIPGKASGLKVRCSACLTLFAVPWVKEAIHDKAADWLDDDKGTQDAEDSGDAGDGSENWDDVDFESVDSPVKG